MATTSATTDKHPVGVMTLLGIYLNDHLAGATSGAELAQRMLGAHSGSSRRMLEWITDEIKEDRVALLNVMARLGVPVRRYKIWAGWTAERMGRLKWNGRLMHRSPLSDLMELETLRLGVEGKTQLWRILRRVAETEARLDKDQLDTLLTRARRQASALEELHLEAADRVLPPKRS